MTDFERKVEKMEEEKSAQRNEYLNAELAKRLTERTDAECLSEFFALLSGYAGFRAGKVLENA